MFTKSSVFTRKKALLIVAGVAFLLLALIVIKWRVDSRTSFTTLADREKFLKNLGWEIDSSTEEFHSVIIPESFDGIMAEYNRMQKEQGFDLEEYAGKKLTLYTYRITNHPDAEEADASLYVYRSALVGGDVHSTSFTGFMTALR